MFSEIRLSEQWQERGCGKDTEWGESAEGAQVQKLIQRINTYPI